MTPLVVMVAPNGARRTKKDHPHLPLTPAEIAIEAELCGAAGATVLHVHVRDDDGRHSLDPDLYRAAIDAVRRTLGDRMVIQITTEAVGRYSPAEQMATVREVHPEAVSLGLTELIPDDGATDAAAAFLAWLQRERIAPQYILYSPKEVARFHELRCRGVIPQRRPFALFVLGRYAEQTEAQPRDVLPYLAAHDADCPWALCAFRAAGERLRADRGRARRPRARRLREQSAAHRWRSRREQRAARGAGLGRRPTAWPRRRRHRHDPRVPRRAGVLRAWPTTPEAHSGSTCAGGITRSSTIWLR